MRKVRKVFVIGLLSTLALILLGTVCAREYTSEILVAESNKIDQFLQEFNPNDYHVPEKWQFGIIVRKSWTDSSGGAITGMQLRIRTMAQETVEFNFTNPNWPEEERWDDLSPGDLIAFENPLFSAKSLILGTQIIMKSTKTGFTKVLRTNTDL